MLNAVIFDMDGVLVNSEPVHQRLEKEMFEELGLQLTFEEQQSFVGMSARDSWTLVINKYRLPHNPEELLITGRTKYWEVLRNTNEVKLMEGIDALISELRSNGIELLLASSASSATIGQILKKFNLENVFPRYIGGDQVSCSKPDPEIFIKIAAVANVSPLECVVIEDASHGVTAAKAAGMKCIGFQNHHSGKQDLSHADWIVHNLQEISLKKLRKLTY